MRTASQIKCDISRLRDQLDELEGELEDACIHTIGLGDVFNITTEHGNTYSMMYVAIAGINGFICVEPSVAGTYLGSRFANDSEALEWLNDQQNVEYLGQFGDLFERKC